MHIAAKGLFIGNNLNAHILFALLTLAYSVGSAASQKSTTFEHSYASCSAITSEYLTLIQLYQRGIGIDQALGALPFKAEASKSRATELYALIKKLGVIDTYVQINTNFARCSRLVYEQSGTPEQGNEEYGYYFCSGENKVRFETILTVNETYDLNKVISATPDSHMDVAITYFNLIKDKGILAAFDYTANNFKACLKQL
jgi:hypothetical protein